MSDIIIDGNDGNFIIESGSNSIPVFKVDGNTVTVSGSLIPGDASSANSISELGSEAKPWKELYVESASINFVDTSESEGASDRVVKFQRSDVEDLKAGRMPGNAAPLSRAFVSFNFGARISAANNWYCKSSIDRQYLANALFTSDPNGTNGDYRIATLCRDFIATQNLTVLRGTATFQNASNNDNLILTMFKGTFANDSNAVIAVTRIGSEFAPTMTRNKNFVVSQNISSNANLSAGDFIFFTLHVTSHTVGTTRPNVGITLDLQYR
tara:strand:+ start:67 stop:870 length:804 start_codon:yes stop_codon:yes gene_type:complete